MHQKWEITCFLTAKTLNGKWVLLGGAEESSDVSPSRAPHGRGSRGGGGRTAAALQGRASPCSAARSFVTVAWPFKEGSQTYSRSVTGLIITWLVRTPVGAKLCRSAVPAEPARPRTGALLSPQSLPLLCALHHPSPRKWEDISVCCGRCQIIGKIPCSGTASHK